MSFTAGLRRLVGSIQVSEKNGIISMRGLPADTISSDIRRIWETNQINAKMFSSLGRNELSFYSFYAMDVAYMLRYIAEDNKRRTNKRAAICALEELKANTWLARTTDESIMGPLDLGRLSRMIKTPMEHQLNFLKHYNYIKPRYNLNGMLLAAGAGGGKTYAGLAISECANVDHTIVICPKNALRRVWASEIENLIKGKTTYWVSDENKPIDVKSRYFLFNFEALDKALLLANQLGNKRTVVILDESHGLNNSESLRTERFLAMCDKLKPEHVIWSSGTPIKALALESIPFFRCIDPLFTTEVEAGFRSMFSKDSSKINELLKHRLDTTVFKVPKRNFMDVEPVYRTVRVKIPKGEQYTLEAISVQMKHFIKERLSYYEKHKREYLAKYNEAIEEYKLHLKTAEEKTEFKDYMRMINRFIKEGFNQVTMMQDAKFCNKYEKTKIIPVLTGNNKANFKDAKSVVKYPALKVRGECLGQILGKARSNCHLDMLPYIDFPTLINDAKKKTIIFTSYVNVVNTAESIVTRQGYLPLKVYAETNNRLPEIVGEFEKKPDANPLIATYQSLSTAVPLVMANNIILLNSPFRHHELEQAVARCWRVGQDEIVFVTHVYLDTDDKPNISTRSGDIMEWSKKQVDSLLGIDEATALLISMEELEDEVTSNLSVGYALPISAYW